MVVVQRACTSVSLLLLSFLGALHSDFFIHIFFSVSRKLSSPRVVSNSKFARNSADWTLLRAAANNNNNNHNNTDGIGDATSSWQGTPEAPVVLESEGKSFIALQLPTMRPVSEAVANQIFDILEQGSESCFLVFHLCCRSSVCRAE